MSTSAYTVTIPIGSYLYGADAFLLAFGLVTLAVVGGRLTEMLRYLWLVIACYFVADNFHYPMGDKFAVLVVSLLAIEIAGAFLILKKLSIKVFLTWSFLVAVWFTIGKLFPIAVVTV